MDETYQRPILARYVDPYELIWLATARRLGLHIRRDPAVYSMTDGTGLLALAPRQDLDADDTLPQQVLHEVSHWVVNGVETYAERDWGYELDVPLDDPREHACLRIQCWLADAHGLRGLLANTGLYRPYYDALRDPAEPLDDSTHEARVMELFQAARERVQQEPFWSALQSALVATARIRQTLQPFLDDYATEVEDDALPSLWSV